MIWELYFDKKKYNKPWQCRSTCYWTDDTLGD